MRWVHRFLPVVAVLLFVSSAGWAEPVLAQEATPAADDMMPAGVGFAPVTFAIGATMDDPSDIFIVRITMEPGATLPIEEADPTDGILIVEEGAFTVDVEGEVTVTRGAGLEEAMTTVEETGDLSAAMETVPAGNEVMLEAGDAAYVPGGIAGELRNDGEQPAIGLAILFGPSMDMGAATPEP